jgi:hypothetical protein
MKNRRPSTPTRRRIPMKFQALALSMVLATMAGCGAPEDATDTIEQPGLSLNGLSLNGLSLNGLSLNGLSLNGLSLNGLSLNGLSLNGLSLNGFSDWFNGADGGDTGLHDMTMKYVIRCALSANRTASFTDSNGVVHTWAGALGLADSWDQNPLTDAQKQWVSGCIMAHANSALPAPKQIQVSVRGSAPSLATTPLEKSVVTSFDGAYFGDLFSSTNKRYLCKTNWTPPAGYYATLLGDWGRQCFFSNTGCGGIFTMVDCETACTKNANTDYLFATCNVDGVTYNAVNAYVPRFKRAVEWTLGGLAHFNTACTGCLDNRMMESFTSTSYAQATVTGSATGPVYLDVRYANGGTATGNLRVQVGTVNVMNGTSANWDFPVTGSWSTWKTRTIPANLTANATIKLMGPTSGAAPKVDVVSIRAQ